MKFYNTLSRKKEEFKPIKEGHAGLYCCGPTVYGTAHIGNMRTYLFMDWLRRVLISQGYSLTHVMNITDVGHLVSDGDDGEDKMLKGARELKKTPWEIAEMYTDLFMRDIASLNITSPEIIAKATEHIPQMIEFVQVLCEKGYGYETSDGIYFDVQKFEGYGKLSNLDLEGQQAGARVEVNDEKRHPADFAIWKKAPKEHIMQWESPWGMGYPGWHIECSAMARQYLGDVFDIHTGGVDHIPVHHENEIAQSEAMLGHPAVNTWLHGEFMLVNNGKMSKSLKNNYTLEDLAKEGYSPMHFRFFCANGHYSNKLNFTWEALAGAKTAYERLLSALQVHKNGTDVPPLDEITVAKAEFTAAVCDDINIPKALGIVWGLVRLPQKSEEIYDAVQEMDKILGLSLNAEPTEVKPEADEAVDNLIAKRQEARKNKDFAESDRIRDELKSMGIVLEDTKEGVKWKRS